MTDQTQNPNPAKINPNTNPENVDIFGGSDDIFENSDILEPIKETLEADIEDNKKIETITYGEQESDFIDPIKQESNNVIEQEEDKTTEYKTFDEDDNTLDDKTEQENNYDVDENLSQKSIDKDQDYSVPNISDDVYDVDQSWNNESSYTKPEVLDVEENYDNTKKDVSEEEPQDLNKDMEENTYQKTDQESEDFFEKNDDLPGIENIEEGVEENIEENIEENVEENIQENKNDTFDPLENNFELEENTTQDFEPKNNNFELNDTFENIEPIQEITLDQNLDDEIDFDNSAEIDALDEIDNIGLENIDKFDNTTEQENGETIEQEDDRTIEQENDRTIEQEDDKIIEQEDDETIEQEDDKIIEQEDDETMDQDEELEKEKQEAHEREIQVEVDQDKSDLQKKFYELIREAKNVHELVKKDLSEGFDLLGGNDDRKKTMYKIFVGDEFVNIDRIETLKEDESEETHTLSFVLEDKSLKINVDDELLYDEIEDLIENPNKKMQVSEKLNKFIFLVTEEYKKIEKQKKEKEKRNQIKGIFRNF